MEEALWRWANEETWDHERCWRCLVEDLLWMRHDDVACPQNLRVLRGERCRRRDRRPHP